MDLTTLTRQELENRAEFFRRMANRYEASSIQYVQLLGRAAEAQRAIERYDEEQAKLGAWPGRPLASVAPPSGEA